MMVFGSLAGAQEPPKPSPERQFLQKLVGRWDAAVKIKGAPDAMRGTLEVRKLGELWVVRTLKANLGGLPYEGHGTQGFDPHKRKVVGAWADSITDSLAVTEGAFDEKKQTLIETWSQVLPEGQTSHFKIVTKRHGAERITAVYHRGPSPNKLAEIMTIEYTPAKTAEK
jgi:hypothetical protein